MANHEKTFHLHGGKKFNSLKGLAKELKGMAHDTFVHHVNETKNDFANWVEHSLKNKDLAFKIEKRIDKIEIELDILRHLVHDDDKPKKAAVKKVAAKKVEKTAVKKVVAKKKSPAKKKAAPKKAKK